MAWRAGEGWVDEGMGGRWAGEGIPHGLVLSALSRRHNHTDKKTDKQTDRQNPHGKMDG